MAKSARRRASEESKDQERGESGAVMPMGARGARRVATGIIKIIVIITVTVDIIVIVIVTANVIVIIGGIVGITDIVMVSLFVSLSSELPLRLSFYLSLRI